MLLLGSSISSSRKFLDTSSGQYACILFLCSKRGGGEARMEDSIGKYLVSMGKEVFVSGEDSGMCSCLLILYLRLCSPWSAELCAFCASQALILSRKGVCFD